METVKCTHCGKDISKSDAISCTWEEYNLTWHYCKECNNNCCSGGFKINNEEVIIERDKSMKYELEKNEMELLYHFARETNLLYLSDKFKDKFDKDTIEQLDLLLGKIYKKYENDFR